MIGDGSPVSSFGAMVCLSIEDAKVIEGIAYSFRKRFTIPASGVVNLVFDPTAFTSGIIVFQPVAFDAIGGPFNVDIYREVTADENGTLFNIANRDFSITDPASLIVRKDPTNINTLGGVPFELLVPSNGTGTVATSGAAIGDAIVAKLDTTKKSLVRITNTDNTAAATIGIKTDHFEVA
jgi:hypothetical protein